MYTVTSVYKLSALFVVASIVAARLGCIFFITVEYSRGVMHDNIGSRNDCNDDWEYDGHKATEERCMFFKNVHLLKVLRCSSKLTRKSPLGVDTPVGGTSHIL